MKDFHIFNHNLDVYGYSYNYEMVKAAVVISDYCFQHDLVDILNFEDICIIAEAIYAHWIDGRSKDEDKKYETYPWLDFISEEERNYIQEYADNKARYFINLYLQQKRR